MTDRKKSMEAYRATPITLSRWTNPKPAFSVDCPSPDGYKTRAARLLGDGLNCSWSQRRNYTASPTKFAKFERLYAEGWDASPITGRLIPPMEEPLL